MYKHQLAVKQKGKHYLRNPQGLMLRPYDDCTYENIRRITLGKR